MYRKALPLARAAGAVWARRLAVLGAGLGAAAVVLAHIRQVPSIDALLVLAPGLLSAGVAILCSLGAMGTIWRTGQPGLGRALLGLVIALVTLAYPAYLARGLARQSIVAGVTTDNAAPPRLARSTKAATLRGRHPEALPTPLAIAAPFVLDATASDAYDLVAKAVASLRWRVADAVPPGGRLGLAHLDAVAYSPVMHLPQDVAIRLTPLAGQTRVDVSSVARLGTCDFGQGAATLRQLSDAIDAQSDD